MNAIEEARDLKANPLPQIVMLDPLTHVWNLDKQITALQEQIELLSEQRKEAMEYALDNSIGEDSECKLVAKKTVTTPNRVLNVEKLQKEIPAAYKRIWQQKRDEVKADLDKFGEKVEDNTVNLKISQKLAEPALKAEGHKLEEVLESGGPAIVTFTYGVERK